MAEKLADLLHGDSVTRSVPCCDCGDPVEVTAAVEELAKPFQRELARRGERLLSLREIARCERCAAIWRRGIAQDVNAEHERLQLAVRRLKSGEGTADDRATVLELHSRGEECLAAIEAKRRSGTGWKTGRGES